MGNVIEFDQPHRDGEGAETTRPTQTPADPREERHGLAAAPVEICDTPPFDLPDSYSTLSMDRAFKAHLARFTSGITPFGLTTTVLAWWVHLMGSPGKHLWLAEKAARKWTRFAVYAASAAREGKPQRCIEPLPHDHRFDHPSWSTWPYNLIHQSFLLTQQWWYNATNDIDGLSRHQEQVVSFLARQILDLASPSNFPATNPEVTRMIIAHGGANLVRGFQNFLEDWERTMSGKPPVGADAFVPGRNVATTPGKVVLRNELVELIQYAPTTEKVKAEPVLIVPAWIMKYYILDLSPENSLVRFLVGQGHTVFMISWRNPDARHRDLGMDDYVKLGVRQALDAVTAIVPNQKVHAVGYCIGGTLMSIAAAAMARDGDDRLKTLTLLATQNDFSEGGELMLYISESQVSFLEDMMWEQGFLDTKQMAGAFQLLRSNDLIWSRYVHEYLMGRRQEMFDLMAWNADATRMPYRQHSEYLRKLFLGNELAKGQYRVDDRPVALTDIDVPIFCVSTTTDHVAPWKAVHKVHLHTDTEVTFVLTNGGHNAGIVSEPGHRGRHFRIRTTSANEHFLSPEEWVDEADAHEGSWWPAWTAWLAERSSGETAPPRMGGRARAYRPKGDAPGSYVLQR